MSLHHNLLHRLAPETCARKSRANRKLSEQSVVFSSPRCQSTQGQVLRTAHAPNASRGFYKWFRPSFNSIYVPQGSVRNASEMPRSGRFV